MPEYRQFHDDYDRYMPRQPSYPDQYYDYPNSRFDIPEPRDYRPVYTNNLEDRYPDSDPVGPPRNRRIIYYANLPEVVRSPPTVDLRYRSYNRFDPYYPFEPMSGAYRKPPPAHTAEPAALPQREYMPNSGILKVEGIRRKNEHRGDGESKPAVSNPTARTYQTPNYRPFY